MLYRSLLLIGLLALGSGVRAQDSMVVRIHPAYGHAGSVRRLLLGENYREEWSMEVKLPVVHVSTFNGGLIPDKLGGGMQSRSLRMTDPDGKEWVIRSVEKIPDLVVPQKLRQTFARDLVDDATSAQDPFAALLVPPVADALGVAHTEPQICYIAADPAFGPYEEAFAGTVALIEERAPFPKSDNSIAMLQRLHADNTNSYDAVSFLKARMIDLLFADWDRHEDQWRWYATNPDGGKLYRPIPRDRDQVASVTQGLLPVIVKELYTMPRVTGFTERIRKPDHYLFKSGFLNAQPASQIDHAEWLRIVADFVTAVTDSVLEQSLSRLPPPAYALRHDAFLRILRSRRDGMPAAMERYYRFINEVVDIQLTAGHEQVVIKDSADGTRVTVTGKEGRTLMSKHYPRQLTKEIRLYTMGGEDSIQMAHTGRDIKLRLIRDTGFTPVNLYDLGFPLINAGLNADDGFLLGAGFRYVRQKGFRRSPYASMHQLMLTHSFSTTALKLSYHSEWMNVIGQADLMVHADINAPHNTINFFGSGNESRYFKEKGLRYYRARFSTFELATSIRRRYRNWSLRGGPALQYYIFDKGDNNGRFIDDTKAIGSYDSVSVDRRKLHLGGQLHVVYDTRSPALLPSAGILVSAGITALKGVSAYARDIAQFAPAFSFCRPLNAQRTIVLSNRTGGIVSLGQPAFYQSAFLGGQGNLLGYRQYRFAGRHAAYDNLECRWKIAEVSSYIFPGELGLTGFFDIGRVWNNEDHADTWHNGVGGGLYYVPAQLAVFRLVAGHSTEGWYPYISMGIRF